MAGILLLAIISGECDRGPGIATDKQPPFLWKKYLQPGSGLLPSLFLFERKSILWQEFVN
jgi:hypothetical protein